MTDIKTVSEASSERVVVLESKLSPRCNRVANHNLLQVYTVHRFATRDWFRAMYTVLTLHERCSDALHTAQAHVLEVLTEERQKPHESPRSLTTST